jgi:magnesium transporter
MTNTYSYKDVTWVDLESPTRDEVREVMVKYNIPPLAAEDLLLPTLRPRVDVYPDFIYLILHFPAWKHSHKETSQEMDFIIGKNFIITARYDTIDPIHKFAKMFEVNSVLDRNALVGKNAGYMFYYMIREIYHSLSDELEAIKDNLQDIEKKTFTGQEKEMVYELSNTSRELLGFKHATALHEEILNSFAIAAKPFFGATFSHYLDAILGEYTKVSKTIANISESLAELRETNNALLEAKQSETMKMFTAITVISSFLTIISSWFLVEAPDRPFAEAPHEFWLVGLVMLVVAVIVAGVMRFKKWL